MLVKRICHRQRKHGNRALLGLINIVALVSTNHEPDLDYTSFLADALRDGQVNWLPQAMFLAMRCLRLVNSE